MWYMEETTDSGWHALRNMPEVSQSLAPDVTRSMTGQRQMTRSLYSRLEASMSSSPVFFTNGSGTGARTASGWKARE